MEDYSWDVRVKILVMRDEIYCDFCDTDYSACFDFAIVVCRVFVTDYWDFLVVSSWDYSYWYFFFKSWYNALTSPIFSSSLSRSLLPSLSLSN